MRGRWSRWYSCPRRSTSAASAGWSFAEPLPRTPCSRALQTSSGPCNIVTGMFMRLDLQVLFPKLLCSSSGVREPGHFLLGFGLIDKFRDHAPDHDAEADGHAHIAAVGGRDLERELFLHFRARDDFHVSRIDIDKEHA